MTIERSRVGVTMAAAFACGWLLMAANARGQGAEPTLTWTRHGEAVFEAEVWAGGAAKDSRLMLVEKIEISGVRKKDGWGEFTAVFLDATSRAWLAAIPSAAGAEKGKVVVAFAVRADGTLEGAPVVERSSGDASIDAATREAIAKSAPFKALPGKYKKDAAQVVVTFAYDHPHVPSAPENGAPQ